MLLELFITCPQNIEELLCQELKTLGVTGVRTGFCGVYAPQTIENVYLINYCSRLATRVLWPLVQFRCPDKDALYRASKEIPWLDFLDENKTFAIDSNVSHPNIRHSLYGAQVMKDGLCDHIREKRGARPSVDVRNPDVQLNLFIHNNLAVISFDTSGSPLYKRGWRSLDSTASIQETLAAALLLRSGYTAESVLCDPFCGSGTFLIEAALIATQTPPGFYRKKWGMSHLPGYDPTKWDVFKKQQNEKRIPLAPGKIFGADKDREAVHICRTHLKQAGFADSISITQIEVNRYVPPTPPDFVISNPPYGKRLETSIAIYQQLGQFFKHTCQPQAQLFVLAPDKNLARATGLKSKSNFLFLHGGLKIGCYHLSS